MFAHVALEMWGRREIPLAWRKGGVYDGGDHLHGVPHVFLTTACRPGPAATPTLWLTKLKPKEN